jgi:hypothetical protein
MRFGGRCGAPPLGDMTPLAIAPDGTTGLCGAPPYDRALRGATLRPGFAGRHPLVSWHVSETNCAALWHGGQVFEAFRCRRSLGKAYYCTNTLTMSNNVRLQSVKRSRFLRKLDWRAIWARSAFRGRRLGGGGPNFPPSSDARNVRARRRGCPELSCLFAWRGFATSG